MDLMLVSTQHFCNVSFRCSEVHPREREAQIGACYGNCCCPVGNGSSVPRWSWSDSSWQHLMANPARYPFSCCNSLSCLLTMWCYPDTLGDQAGEEGKKPSCDDRHVFKHLVKLPVDNSFIHLKLICFLWPVYCELEQGHTPCKKVYDPY